MASSLSSPCAACKFLRRKCTAECVFAPYFPPDQPQKFANVHKIFGASNVSKILNDLPQHQREDAVNSLAYEADARVKDPVYGCVGSISFLQRQVVQLQQELVMAHSDLARYTGAGMIAGPSMQQQQAGPSISLGIGMGLMVSPAARDQILATEEQLITREAQQMLARDSHYFELQRETQLSREHMLDHLSGAGGGSYETGLAPYGMAGALGSSLGHFPARTGIDGGIPGSGVGGGLGHFSPT